ncbi:oligopeptide ABC transporter periplasmic peptide-binding protein [Alcanivorax hongdengensis A-11-3]|uniref:Oligopeptide ABC transporter periplasmic peptide-binding protein n=1 Tax=Alcanivorax hongdengensis A-11-3 TaxID=1177179 RepID=L0WFJ0_9GAMM|nr:extracellular solute-binding protein [Alcanivorax hongdengensis]EKF74897.1 oligopeptide ABC transporter periplasmic peptide-binding protein [Alcanivorax hongdengensis A-11-3]
MQAVCHPKTALSHPFHWLTLLALCLLAAMPATTLAAVHKSHAIAMYGQPKYPAGFDHFDFVNPAAPKGGSLRRHLIGTFDSLNPFIPKGDVAAGIGAYVYESLTIRSDDEPFTQYGLLAQSMEWPDDRSWIRFHLNPAATFSDGKPVTASDVAWTFQTLMNKGAPFYSYYYHSVDHVEVNDTHTVTFHLKPGDNRELILIIGQLPVLPEHYWKDRDFAKTGLDAPVGSGPYAVSKVEPGKRIVFKRRQDYWGKDLAVNKGRYNFDTVSFDYYLDDTVALQAFKRGDYDWRSEMTAKKWATAYQGKPFDDGTLVKEEIHHQNPAGMQGLAYNLRRPIFQSRVLREALAYALDFEWTNANLFYGQYKRTRSYFQNSEMAATGLPSKAELKLLTPFRDQLPERVFTESYQPPKSDGSGRPRANLRHAQVMLKEAGYSIRDNQLYTPDGKPVRFEIMTSLPDFDRIVQPFTRNLKALGVDARVVRVDSSQYLQRYRNFNFDMVIASFPQSTSPGNEQREFWGSKAAEVTGSRNIIGIQNPAVDALVDDIISATTRGQLVTACRALDRVLQWNFYVIPNWYVDRYRVAYQSRLKHPALGAYVSLDAAIDTWWDSSAQ